jgi:hypothetical protein
MTELPSPPVLFTAAVLIVAALWLVRESWWGE